MGFRDLVEPWKLESISPGAVTPSAGLQALGQLRHRIPS